MQVVLRHQTLEVAVPDEHAAWGRLAELEGYERDRIARLRNPADRLAYLLGHLLVREVAGELLAQSHLRLRQQCPGCGGSGHGRPFVVGTDDDRDEPAVSISLSHSVRTRGYGEADSILVAALAALSSRPVGIDVEHADARVPRRAFTDRETAALAQGLSPVQVWTRKEAAVKAGATTLDRLNSFDVLDQGAGAGVKFTDFAVPGGLGSWACWG